MNKNKSFSNDSILTLNAAANKRQSLGYSVVNGTIGMMLNDEGHLPIPELFRHIVSTHTGDEDFTYPSVSGGEDYILDTIGWFFGSLFTPEYISKNVKGLATCGGTGAITIAVREASKDKNTIVLIPSVGWPNYENVCVQSRVDFEYYHLFDDEKKRLNLESIESLFEKFSKKHENIIFVINDPCQNPTGYSMDEDEWDALRTIIKKYKAQTRVTLILDAAYFDFADDDVKKMITEEVKKVAEYIDVFVAFSYSKTFSFYGLRIGCLLLLSKDCEKLDAAFKDCLVWARALWSVSNHMANNCVREILENKEKRQYLVDEINESREIVKKRADIFLQEAKEEGLVVLPHRFGFFVTIIVDDSLKLCEELMKEDIYVLPIQKHYLRVALCSIPTKKIYGLASKIKAAC